LEFIYESDKIYKIGSLDVIFWINELLILMVLCSIIIVKFLLTLLEYVISINSIVDWDYPVRRSSYLKTSNSLSSLILDLTTII
jgi:hypothetical protein